MRYSQEKATKSEGTSGRGKPARPGLKKPVLGRENQMDNVPPPHVLYVLIRRRQCNPQSHMPLISGREQQLPPLHVVHTTLLYTLKSRTKALSLQILACIAILAHLP